MGKRLVKKKNKFPVSNGMQKEIDMLKMAKEKGMEMAKLAAAVKVNFSVALRWMRAGVGVRREKWADKSARYQISEDGVCIEYADSFSDEFGGCVGHVGEIKADDILATDWMIWDAMGDNNDAMDKRE